MRHAKRAANQHHADEGARPDPQCPATLQRRPQADGHHDGNVIQPAERMHDAGGERLGRAVTDMGQCGRNAENEKRDNRKGVHDVGPFSGNFIGSVRER